MRAARKAFRECKIRAELMLTVHWGGRSSWTWSLVRGHSRCRICTGTTPGAGCGPGTSCAGRVPTRSWPAGPAGCALGTGHFPHRSCERNTRLRVTRLPQEGFQCHLRAAHAVSPACLHRPALTGLPSPEPPAGTLLLCASGTLRDRKHSPGGSCPDCLLTLPSA